MKASTGETQLHRPCVVLIADTELWTWGWLIVSQNTVEIADGKTLRNNPRYVKTKKPALNCICGYYNMYIDSVVTNNAVKTMLTYQWNTKFYLFIFNTFSLIRNKLIFRSV